MDAFAAFGALIETIAGATPRFTTHLAHLSVFPPSWHNRPRCIDQHLIHLVVRGRGRLVLDPAGTPQKHDFGPGDLLWVAPFTSFETLAPDAQEPPRLYHFRFRIDRPGPRRSLIGLDVPHVLIAGCDELAAVCERWVTAFRRAGPDLAVEQQACCLLLACGVRERLAVDRRSEGLDADRRGIVEQYVAHHMPGSITGGDLARAVGLGPTYFARLFRRSYGMAPRTWILHQRLGLAAAMLLESDDPVGSIASSLGYRQVPLFCKQFKARYAMTPGDYRRRHYSPYGR